MSRLTSRCRRQQGLTLIELMVSMVLGIVLMAGVLQLFAANKSSYQLTQAVSEMQENARFAMSRLERDIRMAGFLGCTGRDQGSIVINPVLTLPSAFTPDNGIEGWEADGTAYGSFTVIKDASVSDASTGTGWSTAGTSNPSLDSGTNSVANSDVLRLWQIDGNGTLAEVNAVGTTVEADTLPSYKKNDMMMLTDCASVDIAKVCDMTGSDASLSGCNHASFKLLNSTGTVHAFKLTGKVYFVGKRDDTATNPPSLFVREISANATASMAQELVEGVESLQFLYGEDRSIPADAVADSYIDAAQVSDWNNVVGVRVEMLMQSRRTDLVEGSQTVTFNGASITSSDGRLRYPFVASIALRNRTR